MRRLRLWPGASGGYALAATVQGKLYALRFACEAERIIHFIVSLSPFPYLPPVVVRLLVAFGTGFLIAALL